MNKASSRIEYIDLAKFVAIFCMVICHAGMHNKVTTVIYAFHMPLFFFLSGYLFDRNKKVDDKTYLKKRAYSLLIPYALFSLILCFGTKQIVDWGYLLYASRDAIAEAQSFTPLWFLPCFFISSIGFYFVNKIYALSPWFYYIIIVAIASGGFVLSVFRRHFPYGYPGNFDVALVGVLIMALGELSKRIKVKTIWGGVIMVMGFMLSFLNQPESLTEGNPHVELSTGTYGNPFLFLIVAFMICFGIITLCRGITENKLMPSFMILLSFYGANTITILCFHGIIISFLKGTMKHLTVSLFGYEFLVSLIITLITFVIMYPIVKYINKEIPNIIGKK